MKVAIRADASVEIGSGHIMRCMTLGNSLRRAGAEVVFISERMPGHLFELMDRRGYTVFPIESGVEYNVAAHSSSHRKEDFGEHWQRDLEKTLAIFSNGIGSVDWLIVDHYRLDSRWEEALRGFAAKIMVIDDLADRSHDCDLLLDQNILADEDYYRPLVPWDCKILAGAEYAILRKEFLEARARLERNLDRPRRILIGFGGSDPTNETAKALDALRMLGGRGFLADVLLGGSNPRGDEIRRLYSDIPGVTIHGHVDRPSEFILKADLAIGAGGVSELERCCLCLPTLIVAVAENQVRVSRMVAKTGAARFLGRSGEFSAETLALVVGQLLDRPNLLQEMAERACGLVDGLGADRVRVEMERLDERKS